MRIVIVGPGAIGCLFAGFFAGSGKDVGLLDKNPDRVADIAAKGVRIESGGVTHVVRVAVSAAPGDLGAADLLFVCVKSYDVPAAIRHALPLVGKDTVIVSLANGSGNVEKIAEVADPDRIVCGITSHGSTSLGHGHVRHAGAGATIFASFVPAMRQNAELAAGALDDAGMESRVSDDMRGVIWSKLVVSAAINPLTAVMDVENGRLLDDPWARVTMRRAAEESSAVAAAKGIRLAYDDPVEEIERVCRDTARNISSMLQDVRRGRRTEVDAINGVVVADARALGIAVPTNEMLIEQVRKRYEGGM